MKEHDTPSMSGVWLGAQPLVLASNSESRRALLAAAGLRAHSQKADVDERAIERQFFADGGPIEGLAAALAEAKALSVSASRGEAYCLGADQTLLVGNAIMHKPKDLNEAAQSLAALSGRTHRLISAFCVARFGKTLIVEAERADLHMRALDRPTIARYFDLAGTSVLSSVGAYQIEGLGIHLFDHIEGDFTTILGLPMLRLLAWLRRERLVSL